MSQHRPFDVVLDECIEGIVSGRLTYEQCLILNPEHRDRLQQELRFVLGLASMPRPVEQRPDPVRREEFMDLIRRTPQEPARRRRRFGFPALPRLGAPSFSGPSFSGWSVGGLALRAVPAGALALLAVILVFSRGAEPASAATLTVFVGQVEQRVDGAWQPLTDGAEVLEGLEIRTLEGGHALLTFPDGSTASLAQGTQVVISRLSVNGDRHIEIAQESGRLWNDVVPIAGGDIYRVRTPHATVEAHGTVFETVIAKGTEVSTVDGLVRVISATSTVDLEAGQFVRATEELIAEPQALRFIGDITVRAPMAAALTSPDGAASGMLPTGLTFRQIPGVTTTAENDGIQHLYVTDVTPGMYSLWLRRFTEGDGIVVIQSASARVNIPVPANVATARVLIAIDVVDGNVAMRALDTKIETVSEDEAPTVRVVDTPRSRRTLERAAQAGSVTPSVSRPEETAGPDSTASATPSPEEVWDQELREAVVHALTTQDNAPLDGALRRMLEGNRQQDAARLRALAKVMEDQAARVRIAAVLLVAGDGLLGDFEDAVRRLDDSDLRRALVEGIGGASGAESPEPAPTRERTEDRDDDRDDRDERDDRRNNDRRDDDRRNDRDDDRGDGDNDRDDGREEGRGSGGNGAVETPSPEATASDPGRGRGNDDDDDRRSNRGFLNDLLDRWRERLRERSESMDRDSATATATPERERGRRGR